MSSRTSEHVREALETVREHRMRSALVVLGVAIGVTTVMTLVAVLNGLWVKLTRDVRSSDNVVIRLAKFGIVIDPRDLLHRPEITVQDWRAIRQELDTVHLAEFIEGEQGNPRLRVEYRDQESSLIQVFGSTWSMARVYNIPLVEGRYLTEEDVHHARRVCVLGNGPLADLFPNTDPVGKRVRIGQRDYTVVGAFAKRDSLFGGLADNFVAVPYTAYRKDFAVERLVFSAIDMVPPDGVTAEQMSDDVRALMRARHRLKPADEDDFDLVSQDQVQQFLAGITGPMAAVLLAVGSVGLMVGGIGVMAIMLVSVTERTREIGVRMALGARRRDVLWQFLVEAATLTGAGGAIGIAIGLSLATALQHLFDFPAAVPPAWIAAALGVSVGVGLLCGLYPAHRASHLDPVAAMRSE